MQKELLSQCPAGNLPQFYRLNKFVKPMLVPPKRRPYSWRCWLGVCSLLSHVAFLTIPEVCKQRRRGLPQSRSRGTPREPSGTFPVIADHKAIREQPSRPERRILPRRSGPPKTRAEPSLKSGTEFGNVSVMSHLSCRSLTGVVQAPFYESGWRGTLRSTHSSMWYSLPRLSQHTHSLFASLRWESLVCAGVRAG